MGGNTAKDITGQRFGALTAVERCGTHIRPSGKKRAVWRFACDCGGSAEKAISQVIKSEHPGCVACFSDRARERAKIKPPPLKAPENITGQRFDSLVALDYRALDNKWRCACDCGGETYRRLCDLRTNLKRGNRSNCEKCRIRIAPNTRGMKINRPQLNLVGQKFGALTVISRAESTPSGAIWNCSCNCGAGFTVRMGTSQLKNTKNPGCRECESDRRAVIHLTHGGAYKGVTRLYAIWKGMLKRCRDLENPHYGGKGITVCKEWEDFRTFRAWARAAGYQDHLTIDRLDPSKGYHAKNCEWVTPEENSRRVSRPKMRAA